MKPLEAIDPKNMTLVQVSGKDLNALVEFLRERKIRPYESFALLVKTAELIAKEYDIKGHVDFGEIKE